MHNNSSWEALATSKFFFILIIPQKIYLSNIQLTLFDISCNSIFLS